MLTDSTGSLRIMTESEKAMLELKIYQPYFISRSTVIEYHNDIC
jgi:hypothetical protein